MEHIRVSKKTIIVRKIFQKRPLPEHLGKSQLSVWTLVPGQSFPFPFGAGLEQVRVRVLCPTPHVTLQGCHGDHRLQKPFTDDLKGIIRGMTALKNVSTVDFLNC